MSLTTQKSRFFGGGGVIPCFLITRLAKVFQTITLNTFLDSRINSFRPRQHSSRMPTVRVSVATTGCQ